MIKIAAPLYIIREECTVDLFSVLEKLADLGFDGVEFLGLFGHDAASVRNKLDELHLSALGNHYPYALLDQNPEQALAEHQILGCHYMTVSDFPENDLDAVAHRLEHLSSLAAAYDIRLLYHNHAKELMCYHGDKTQLDVIMETVSPEALALEPDLGWIEIGGKKPADYLIRYRDRCPVIHLKDYYADGPVGHIQGHIPARGDAAHGHFEFRPTGYGIVNMPALIPLCLACDPQWFVVDHDLAYDRNSFDDLKLSLDYVKSLLTVHHW